MTSSALNKKVIVTHLTHRHPSHLLQDLCYLHPTAVPLAGAIVVSYLRTAVLGHRPMVLKRAKTEEESRSTVGLWTSLL
eukprot:436858-Pyramimonas_sp.AAC.1